MITHSHKQIKKHLPTFLHLHLHSPTPLECRSAPDDQSKIVGTELAVVFWSICVCVSRAGQDCAAVYTGLEALFAESEAFEFGEFVAFACTAIHQRSVSSILGERMDGERTTWRYLSVSCFRPPDEDTQHPLSHHHQRPSHHLPTTRYRDACCVRGEDSSLLYIDIRGSRREPRVARPVD